MDFNNSLKSQATWGANFSGFVIFFSKDGSFASAFCASTFFQRFVEVSQCYGYLLIRWNLKNDPLRIKGHFCCRSFLQWTWFVAIWVYQRPSWADLYTPEGSRRPFLLSINSLYSNFLVEIYFDFLIFFIKLIFPVPENSIKAIMQRGGAGAAFQCISK